VGYWASRIFQIAILPAALMFVFSWLPDRDARDIHVLAFALVIALQLVMIWRFFKNEAK